MIPTPEHEHSHGHHGTGLRWLDLTAAVSGIFIAVVSLWVSIEHGKTMEKMVEQNEKMVAANTMPFLTFAGSELDPATNKPLLRLYLKNGGVGPALIDWFEVRYRGVAYSSSAALLRACCAAALPKAGDLKGVVYSNVSESILPARETIEFLTVNAEAGKDLYTALDQSRKDMTLTACYCSVLDECWQTDFNSSRPKKVSECKAPKLVW